MLSVENSQDITVFDLTGRIVFLTMKMPKEIIEAEKFRYGKSAGNLYETYPPWRKLHS